MRRANGANGANIYGGWANRANFIRWIIRPYDMGANFIRWIIRPYAFRPFRAGAWRPEEGATLGRRPRVSA